MKTNDVEAFAASLGYFNQLVQAIADAGDGRAALLADLGDKADQGALLRLERTLGARVAEVPPVVQAIRDAAALRRRDPKELAQAIEDLRSDSFKTRAAATDRLGRTGVDALPALVDLLQSSDPAGERSREIARGLVRDCGADGRRALVVWLGTPDIAHWPGVIAALDATDDDDIYEFFLAPTLVVGTPPEVRDRALAALQRHAARCARQEAAAGGQRFRCADAVDGPPDRARQGHRLARADGGQCAIAAS